MPSWPAIVGSAAAGWIAMTVAAVGQSKDGQLPTGDVWITPEHPYQFYLRPKAKMPSMGTALGDVWVIPHQDNRSAQAKPDRQEEATQPVAGDSRSAGIDDRSPEPGPR
jgi:hypothetical protein